jgi:hypothetical protein
MTILFGTLKLLAFSGTRFDRFAAQRRRTRRPRKAGKKAVVTSDLDGHGCRLQAVGTWHVWKRDGDAAYVFMCDLKDRLANRVQLTSDGFTPYRDAVGGTFGSEPNRSHVSTSYAERQNLTMRNADAPVHSRDRQPRRLAASNVSRSFWSSAHSAAASALTHFAW